MTAFFKGLGYLFTEILFFPLDLLRMLELQNWWIANIITWIFIIISCVATWYWLQQLTIFKRNGDDDQDTTAHSFLS
jgi:hypothetical protein